MADKFRNADGTFKPGHSFGKGRPPRRYSIASALARFSDDDETVDDDGNILTRAEAAALWMWRCALNIDLPFRERLEALREIRKAIEPPVKVDPTDELMTDEDEERLLEALASAPKEDIDKLRDLTTSLLGGTPRKKEDR